MEIARCKGCIFLWWFWCSAPKWTIAILCVCRVCVYKQDEIDNARREYVSAVKKLRKTLGIKGELKACYLKPDNKRFLYNVVRKYDSASVSVNKSRVYDYIMNNKASICRYKDYALKRCVKLKLQSLLDVGRISKDEDIEISIYIDEQLTASDGYYTLKDSIREELMYGIVNFDYGVSHPNMFDSDVCINIHYCDSSKNYLIQASDILANRIWTSYVVENAKLRKIPNHTFLTLP